MQLEELHALISVADSGSFITAADHLGIPRSTLRRRVASLEAHIQRRLLDRSRQGVKLTPAGQLIVRKGRRLLQEAAVIVSAVRNTHGLPQGQLRMVLPPGLPPHALIPFLHMFRERYPDVELVLSFAEDPSAALTQSTDVVVHYGPAPEGPWESLDLVSVRVWLVAAASYVERHGMPRSPSALRDHVVLAWQPPNRDAHFLPLRGGGWARVEPALITSDVHLLRQAAIDGSGIAFLPDAMLPDPHVAPGAVVPVLDHAVGEKQTLRLTLPDALAEAPALRSIVEAVRLAVGI